MLGWFSCAASFASLRNIFTKLACFERCGRMRLMTMVFSNPSSPACRARKISAMPPTAMRSISVYLPNFVETFGRSLLVVTLGLSVGVAMEANRGFLQHTGRLRDVNPDQPEVVVVAIEVRVAGRR